jgi:predicted Zn-dependent protease
VTTTRRTRAVLVPLALLGVAASSYVPWEDLTEADWLYAVATRVATVDGHRIHYPTPTAELAKALETRSETAALRHLAEARRELGDLAGALAALERWAEAEGAEAWAEAARWAAERKQMAFAFRAAERALPGLPADARRRLAGERVSWADAFPDVADPLAMRKVRAELLEGDGAALEDWLRALEKAGRLEELDAALTAATALPPERRLLLRSDLAADHGQLRRAFQILDAEIEKDWSLDVRRAYARRVDQGHPGGAESWRATLERGYDARALIRLTTYFQGHGRGGAVADLLGQIERRHEAAFDRAAWLVLARLHQEIDAVPEAFRARLAASQRGGIGDQIDDLAALARLALEAGGRTLPWGTYNDEPYRWVARIDRTPGFWTGGVSFLLTGQDWKEAVARLESESVPDRTFAAARTLLAELERRAPGHASLPSLRVAVMRRHVERGEGREALALLPGLESGPPGVTEEARAVALLAMRQVEVPLADELRLYRARLRALAPDGSRPEMTTPSEFAYEEPTFDDEPTEESEPAGDAWKRRPRAPRLDSYATVLNQAVARMEERDRSHRASIDLLLGEMDRLPDAPALWSFVARRLESWNLDDELGPRYERALERFDQPGWWSATARWYARRERHRELDRLARDLAGRFRGAAIFARVQGTERVLLEITDQPRAGDRVRLAPWADWVRLKALERFPHSPTVYREAIGRLLRRSVWEANPAGHDTGGQRVIVEDDLLETRRFAVLFADADRREEYLAAATREGRLAALLAALEAKADRTPPEDQLLFEGWARLSRFEQAAPAADRLAAAYPGDGELARRVLSLHRSLAGLDPAHAGPAQALVARTAPAVADPAPLWTELGELEVELGRPEAAKRVWRQILERDPRNPERISELATLLWDYGEMAEALTVVEEGRRRLGRPRLLAFEAGVLREEVRDLRGAIREYLEALRPEAGGWAWETSEYRASRRLAQLLGRERVLGTVEERVAALRPGVREDEEMLAAYFLMSDIQLEEWTDEWIDEEDLPRDPVERARRAAARQASRPLERRGIARVADALLRKALAMLPAATDAGLLDAADRRSQKLVQLSLLYRPEPDPRAREIALRNAVLARRSTIAPTEEERVAREVERARYLIGQGARAEADAVWAALVGRIGALPEGAPRMRAEVERCAYLERTEGAGAAATEWSRLATRYPWSLGILEDRLAFLARHGRGEEARRLLEGVVPRAGRGHREALLERLTHQALEARDLPQARRAVTALLTSDLDEGRRLGALHLLARLSLREDAAFDPLALAKAESQRVRAERHADLFETLARAADAERSWGTATTLWIEALNRRLERSWLAAACRSADKADRADAFLGFFEAQRERSPRDVRWAVAVREIRLHRGDLEGAIAMAKAAVEVRPDRESLWREAADLLIRADRVREAADVLEGWSRPRPADETVAGWRSELYARARDGDRALAVEREALAAFARESAGGEEGDDALAQRTARAAGRLRSYGHPRLAWRLLAPDDDVAKVVASALSPREQAELALATGRYLRLIRRLPPGGEAVAEAAAALAESGRPQQREEVQAFLIAQFFPSAAGAPPSSKGSDTALRRWWGFVGAAGLEGPVRTAVARRYVETTPGPWQTGASAQFVRQAGQTVVQQPRGVLVFSPPPLEALWVRELVRRDQAEALGAFLEPRWAELLARVRSPAPLPAEVARVEWSRWLDDRAALETWSRHVAATPARVAEVGEIHGDRRLWDRCWALAARGWDVTPLVALLPEAPRTAWFRHWQQPSASDPNPVARARGQNVESVTVALGRLVEGAPQAVADPLIAKLRGPRTVGDVLGLGNAQPWRWPEFEPRRDARGEVAETGDDRVVGERADAGRLPGALWGERPGEAWYALETLARLREGDPEAPFVPLEVPHRGRESERALLAMRLAGLRQDLSLVAELDDAVPAAVSDHGRLRVRLQLLVRAGETGKARAVLAARVRALAPSMKQADFRALRRLAEDLGLPGPLELVDAGTPMNASLLAALTDRHGVALASRFQASDAVEFRAALAARWGPRASSLGADEIRYYLRELWAHGAADLPRRGLRALGGVWPHAADWLARQALVSRGLALEAIEALPDNSRLEELLAREAPDDTTRLLRVRVHLARQEDDRALALVDEMLAGLSAEDPLTYQPVAVEPPADGEAEESLEAEPLESAPPPEDPVAARLLSWLRPFREAGRASAVEQRFRDALRSRREKAPVPVASWRLALELAPPAERPALLQELERAWMRGDWPPEALGDLVRALAGPAPDDARRFLARWPQRFDYETVARRARALIALKDPEGAARLLVESRARTIWTTTEEVQAFDLWRTVAPEPPAASRAATRRAADPAPSAAWAAALPFWRKPAPRVGADLAAHLRSHPYDLLAARAVLRAVGPGDADMLDRASAVLEESPALQSIGDPGGDAVVIRLRAARGLLAASRRAAHTALGDVDVNGLAEDLARRRFRRADVNAALADVPRIAAPAASAAIREAALALLEDRDPEAARSLRQELSRVDIPGPSRPFRLVQGKPAPYRPRDLDWSVVSQAVAREENRP